MVIFCKRSKWSIQVQHFFMPLTMPTQCQPGPAIADWSIERRLSCRKIGTCGMGCLQLSNQKLTPRKTNNLKDSLQEKIISKNLHDFGFHEVFSFSRPNLNFALVMAHGIGSPLVPYRHCVIAFHGYGECEDVENPPWWIPCCKASTPMFFINIKWSDMRWHDVMRYPPSNQQLAHQNRPSQKGIFIFQSFDFQG